jgi:MSHA biogenesis protein MshM
MRQLKERITHSFMLGPLPPRDVNDYVNFRLRAAGYHGPALFGADALKIIADASDGLTRRINIYADKTLLAAFAAGTHTVTADHARAAITDTQIIMTRRESPRRLAMAASLGVAAGVVAGYLLGQAVNSPVPALAAASNVRPAAPPPAQAPASPPAPAPVAAPPAAAPAAIPVAATATPPAKEKPAAVPGDPVANRIAAGRDLLANTAAARYAVQLMVTDARERAFLESYLGEAGRSVEAERLYLVPQGSAEAPRLGLLLAGYRDRDEALAALDKLPTGLRQFRPYVRTLDAVREDARRASNP